MLEKVYHNIIDTFSISEIVWFEKDGSLLVCDVHCIKIDIQWTDTSYFLAVQWVRCTLQANRPTSDGKEESEDLNGNTHEVIIFAVAAFTCIIVLVGSTVAVCRRCRRFGPANAEQNVAILLSNPRPAHLESISAEGQSSISSGDGLLKTAESKLND